nr:hypothetical protein CPGR_05661 [Mycolicibacter nonchromogenicus]
MCGVAPGVSPLVALIGDQTIADHHEQTALGRLSKQATRQVAQRRTKPGVSTGGEAKLAWRHEPPVLEILEAGDFDSVASVSGEDEDAVALTRT